MGGTSETDIRANATAARSLSTLVLEIQETLPESKSLAKVLPNPFNSEALIYIKSDIRTTAIIADINGRKIKNLGNLEKGHNYFRWSPAGNVPSGVYIVKFGNSSIMTLYLK